MDADFGFIAVVVRLRLTVKHCYWNALVDANSFSEELVNESDFFAGHS